MQVSMGLVFLRAGRRLGMRSETAEEAAQSGPAALVEVGDG
jgi:hypothetical protein